ncbi:6-pyruvoyl tetrahydrobiopterin synthase [Macrococcus hajekii]|uniref:6-carboxy-5,6,7,8-tetrahydropterin synthase n=1 Tax=Macrococcus hajekii TaxID=198482 RepID=A0A4R6BJZ5_9STAP|nr:6-carboxytetrahydropterin synthase [Macrococcus hajekii]TDM01936.1 6-pyruvoyl tetrahydrobiopterin synthase [Macrococcus hajekii]GGB08683.1 hypothetical protein GCM10007190_15870 [Macrococcus hajekii]
MTKFTDITAPQNFKIYDSCPLLKLKFEFNAHCRIFFTVDKYKDLSHHHYAFYLTVSSPINHMGLGVDFFEVEKIYTTYLAPKLNDQLLNHTLPEMNMTAENIAYWLWQQFEQYLPSDVDIETLELFEAPTHSVILNRQIMNE